MALGDERKLKDKAHALVRDGRLIAATDVYVKLITMNRTDPSLRLRHAELCGRLNRYDLAVSSYRVAAHLLAGAGHVAKAHAVLSCAVKLAPTDMALRRAIRDLRGSPAAAPEPQPPPVPESQTTPDGRDRRHRRRPG